jgi:glyoxylase-like metal-dependent hydrolase (beta-lactamase superfamily II)
MNLNHLSLGKFKIYGVRDGFFYLDGGAMFGVVPKVLWQKKYPADKENRIKLGLNSLLIDTGQSLVLIETGVGANLKQKLVEYYSLQREPGLIDALGNVGVSVDDIDYVINTHLHFDHCGGNTVEKDSGEYAPVYSQAKYIIQKVEWKTALNPSARDKPSYLPQYFEPLKVNGLLQLEEGISEVTKGVEVIPVSGHTAGHQCVKIYAEDQVIFFLGDLIPTSAHINLPYIMSYDLYPIETLKNKDIYLKQAVEEEWIIALNHDPDYFFGRVSIKNGKYNFIPL